MDAPRISPDTHGKGDFFVLVRYAGPLFLPAADRRYSVRSSLPD